MAIDEIALGGFLLATTRLLSQPMSLLTLAVTLGSIMILCVVAVPRLVRLSLILGLIILFVITGAPPTT